MAKGEKRAKENTVNKEEIEGKEKKRITGANTKKR